MFKIYCIKCPYEKEYKWTFDKNNPTAFCHSCKSREVVIELGDKLILYRDKKPVWEVSKTALGWFHRYQKVQETGQFNMITEASSAMEEAGLRVSQYKFVVGNYSSLAEASKALVFHEI